MVERIKPLTPEGVRADLIMTLARAWRAYREGRTVTALFLLHRASEQLQTLIAVIGERDKGNTDE